MARPTSVKNVSVVVNGMTYQGTYFVSNSMVHVQSEKGRKATQVGGSEPEALAKMLLSELARSQ